MTKTTLCSALLFSTLTMGCSTTDSSELATGDIEAHIEVTIDDQGSSDSSVFLSDGFSDVVLTGGDELVAVTNDGEFVLSKGTFNGYAADLSDDVEEVTMELRRAAGESALDTRVEIPEPLALDTELDGAMVSLADGDLTITWTNAVDGGLFVHSIYPCGGSLVGLKSFVDDPGSVTIPVSELSLGSPGPEGECRVIAIKRRSPRGDADPKLHEDSFTEGFRGETFEITVVP